jgi:hypothetical protein
LQWTDNSGRSSSQSTNAVECIARVRFGKDKSGNLHVYQKFSGGSTFGSLPGASLAFEHPDAIEVEQLGTDKLVTFSPDESIAFLKLTANEDLQKVARKDLQKLQGFPVLFQLRLEANRLAQ